MMDIIQLVNGKGGGFTYGVYHGCQFYWWRKSVYLEKTIDLSHIT